MSQLATPFVSTAELVENSPLFANIPADDCVTILTRAQRKQLHRNKIVFHQGDTVNYVFLLMSGCAKFTHTDEEGKEVILRIAGQGEIINNGCLKCSSHCSTTQILDSSIALMWEGKVFESLMEQFPLFRKNVWSDFHKLLNQMEERYREICTLKVAPRISGELTRLVPRVGKKDEHGHKLSLSQKDLAQLTGTTLFTVNRILNQWELDGVVKTGRNAIVVQDVPALVKMSQMDEG